MYFCSIYNLTSTSPGSLEPYGSVGTFEMARINLENFESELNLASGRPVVRIWEVKKNSRSFVVGKVEFKEF